MNWIKCYISIHDKWTPEDFEQSLRSKRLAAQKLGAGDTAATGFCSSVRRKAPVLVATKMSLVLCLSNDLRSISMAPLKVLDVLDVCLAR